MSFHVVRKCACAVAVPAGVATLTKAAQLGVHRADLAAVGIGDTAALLIDPDNGRLALRVPRDGEAADARAVARGNGSRRSVTVKAALKALGLDAAAVAGRYEVVRHDDLLTVNLPSSGAARLRSKKR